MVQVKHGQILRVVAVLFFGGLSVMMPSLLVYSAMTISSMPPKRIVSHDAIVNGFNLSQHPTSAFAGMSSTSIGDEERRELRPLLEKLRDLTAKVAQTKMQLEGEQATLLEQVREAKAKIKQQDLVNKLETEVDTIQESIRSFLDNSTDDQDSFGGYGHEDMRHEFWDSLDTSKQEWIQNVFKSFSGSGNGGGTSLSRDAVLKYVSDPLVYHVKDHLQGFTGLSDEEIERRLAREGVHHFEVEHSFADPKSASELAWYYSTSKDYLFANAVHPALDFGLKPADGPVLDYSGGVGNNVIMMASAGIRCVYFGIGIVEYAFAEYRVRRLGLQNMVSFLKPHLNSTDWNFDPRKVLIQREKFGTILAIDVLEHIPRWEKTVKAFVSSLRPGGLIIEDTAFSPDLYPPPLTPNGTSLGAGLDKLAHAAEGEERELDLRVHVGRGGTSMAEAMGPSMVPLLPITDYYQVANNTAAAASQLTFWRKSKSR